MPKRKSMAEEEEAAPSRRRSTRLSLGQSLQDGEVETTTPVRVKSSGKKAAAATPNSSKTSKGSRQTETQTERPRSSVKSVSKAVDEPEVGTSEPELAEEEAGSDEISEPPPAKRSRTSRTPKQTPESKKLEPKAPPPTTTKITKKQEQQKKKQPAKTKPTKSEPSSDQQQTIKNQQTKQPPTNADNNNNNNNSERNYWLLKAEPESRFENGTDVKFSIDDLASRTEPEPWDGIRNYVARNNLRAMKKGDLAFFYHSNCKEPGIVGTMEIVGEHEPDLSAHDPKAPYYDPKSKTSDPKWSVVFVEFRSKFAELIGLKELRSMGDGLGKPLANMQMLKQSRLSVSKVSAEEWEYLIGVAESRGTVITR